MRRTTGIAIGLGLAMASGVVLAAGDAGRIAERDWSFDGPFGYYDKGALQRGFQVYREVCAACHGLDHISFRNLADLGYNEAEVKAIAAEYEVEDGPGDDGEMFIRPGIPADRIPAPFANENAARASNGGAYPPDLSLIIKARPNGANYVYSLMTGYGEAPEEMNVPEGMYYNDAYSGHMIAMAAPLFGEDVEYADGSDTSLEAVSADVVSFLAWAAEPEMEKRKRTGIAVMIFLFGMCIISFCAKNHVWADLKKS